MKQDLPDGPLALAAREGDHGAFAALMCRHKGWLFRFVRRYVGDREDAYDLVQESFVSAWSALGRYDPDRPFEAWLRRIALNKCRDRARRNAVRRAALALLGFGAQRETSQAAADTTAAADQALRRLETAVAALPRQLKEPLVLTAIEGLSHKDAAELLGINAKAVETRVYRARKRLAVVLDIADLSDISGDG